jgi:hypothetical protein
VNKEQIEELKRRARAATPGPWRKGAGQTVGPISRDDDQSYGMVVSIADIYGDRDEEDTAYIAAANPAAVLELIALAERAALVTPAPQAAAGKHPVVEMLRRAMDMAGLKGVERGLLIGFFGNEWNKALATPAAAPVKESATAGGIIGWVARTPHGLQIRETEPDANAPFAGFWKPVVHAAASQAQAEPVAWYSGTKFYGTQEAAICGNEPHARPLVYAGPAPSAASSDARDAACVWKPHSDDSGGWELSCGTSWWFPDGGPQENGVKFCPCCGKPAEIAALSAPAAGEAS